MVNQFTCYRCGKPVTPNGECGCADGICLIHADCRDVLPELGVLGVVESLVTDPPYPNASGHFDDAVAVARDVLPSIMVHSAIVFWSDKELPPVEMSLVAVHIWHRTNVNGKPWEPAYQFATDGRSRRSDIKQGPAVFAGVGPGCVEYLGHPTQKPLHIMRWLLQKTKGRVLDPFAGSGTTGRACKDLGRKCIMVEIEEKYCEIAARRLRQEILFT